MKMNLRLILMTGILFFYSVLMAQTGKPLRGSVVDNASGEVLQAVTVIVLNTDPIVGTTSDEDGNFTLLGLPVGRYDIQASYMGYEPLIIREVVVSSGKENVLSFSLSENVNQLNEIVVKPTINKQKPLNTSIITGARMLSVEEASRYAGGFDDPARLVTSFAGVAGNVSSNGIAIRGNSPQSLQWKLEGIEIPNPTHFSDITGAGGGIITALSSQMLDNSDFLTGAFPAEYSNALSGVFDMQLRNGNRWDYEHTIQVGTLGIDVSSEGPFKKGGQSSYLFNYRYATMSLVSDLFPNLLNEAGGMRYQDMSFKMNFPTKKAGTFSVWGIGIIDRFLEQVETDTTKWESKEDNSEGVFKQVMGAGGIGHKIFVDNNTYVKTTLGGTVTWNGLSLDLLNQNMEATPVTDMKGTNWNLVLNSYINRKISANHTNRSGINITGLFYDLDYRMSPDFPEGKEPIATFAESKGNTMLFAAFTNSTFRLNDQWTTNVGFNLQYFALNENFTVEPRASIKWQMLPAHSLAFAYGMHSRHEKIDYYFVATPESGNEPVNKNLKLSKAQHVGLAYDWEISENLHFKAEPYFQYLYNIPVAKDSSFSIINHVDWYLNIPLVSEGRGVNYGIDLTLERYLANGYYYLFTASVFQSRYEGGDDVWRNTRLNRNFLINALAGKEWLLGKNKQNVLGVNVRCSLQGGDRYIPADEAASIGAGELILNTSQSFEKQLSPAFISNLTVSYKMNRKRTAHEFALKIVNLNGHKEFQGYTYNHKHQKVEMYKSAVTMPNISYKIEF